MTDPLREALDEAIRTAAMLRTERVVLQAPIARALRAALDAAPRLDVEGDMPDSLTVNGHLFAHVAACPCPRIQAEVARLAEQDR